MTYTETDLIGTIEERTAEHIGALSRAQLDDIDQFHAGGTAAVDRLLPSLRLGPGMTALDVGSGLGGPARQVARSTGCSVLGVDITPSYVETAAALTRAVGPADRVEFHCTDVSGLDRSDFEAAYTIHVQMNVADKGAFFAAIAARLKPGARLAVFEVCRAGRGDPDLPLPWSIDGTDSFLATPDELRGCIEASGFETVEWADETGWALEWFHQVGARMTQGGPATLPTLLTGGVTRVLNFAGGMNTGILTVHRGSFTRR
ncbi:SAM-dependent methyltransferase [Flexivirga alba]|uniref:SAM-dependent methyltransferase n=1 Tax=Flexivirga alba TaxID=702742 RepID=A0ABW2AD28_9MICO